MSPTRRPTPAARRTAGAAALLLAALLALPAPGAATEIEGVRFAPRARLAGETLTLRSTGLLRWYFFKAYVGALYLGPGVAAEEVLEDIPKRLELHYFHGIEGRDFAKAARAILERSFPAGDLAPLEERIERIGASYRSVEPGDRYALGYVPGVGTELALNGEPLVLIPGADFARAYFAIWLGPEPADEDFKTQLLRMD